MARRLTKAKQIENPNYENREYKFKMYRQADYWSEYMRLTTKERFFKGTGQLTKFLKKCNKELVDYILSSNGIVLPELPISVYVVKRSLRKDKEGKLLRMPDWVATKKLWKEDPESKEKKQLVYSERKDYCNIVSKIQKKSCSNSINETFFKFKPSQYAKRRVYQLEKENQLAYTVYNNDEKATNKIIKSKYE